ncbi:MAG: CopG family transcriptional regulator [Blautia sp.]|nr:CopG family transcriptional regulator [Blautia sp.]
MAISVRISDEDLTLIKKYSKLHGISVSDFARRAMLEKIEDEFDLAELDKAIEEWRKNPVTYSQEEVWRMLETDE